MKSWGWSSRNVRPAVHELHLMLQVVNAVAAKLGETQDVMIHDCVALQMAFDVVARGTKAEGAALEIIPVPGNGWCPGCNRETTVAGPDDACSACGALTIMGSGEPEVVVHELVVQQ